MPKRKNNFEQKLQAMVNSTQKCEPAEEPFVERINNKDDIFSYKDGESGENYFGRIYGGATSQDILLEYLYFRRTLPEMVKHQHTFLIELVER